MLNTVKLIGYISEPETFAGRTGEKVTKFNLPTSKRLKDGSEETQWHNIVLFGKHAENAEKILKKGDKVYVDGEIKYLNLEFEGKKHYKTEIHSFRFIKL